MENIQAMVPDHESRLQSIQVIYGMHDKSVIINDLFCWNFFLLVALSLIPYLKAKYFFKLN